MIWQMKHGFGKILACCLLVVLLLAMSPWAALAEMPNAAGESLVLTQQEESQWLAAAAAALPDAVRGENTALSAVTTDLTRVTSIGEGEAGSFIWEPEAAQSRATIEWTMGNETDAAWLDETTFTLLKQPAATEEAVNITLTAKLISVAYPEVTQEVPLDITILPLPDMSKTVDGADEKIEQASDPDLAAEWPLFRGNANNMGITTAETPRQAAEAYLRAERQLTNPSDWTECSTNPIIAGDHLFIVGKDVLYKLDKDLQEVATCTLTAAADYNSYIAYGGGAVYVVFPGGVIEAVDAVTMTSLWVSEAVHEGYAIASPLLYEDGLLYTGIIDNAWSGTTGEYFCLDAADGSLKWRRPSEGNGYYWAGAVVAGPALVYGNDDGLLVSVNRETGEKLADFQADGSIRSTIARDGNMLYFTTQNGKLYAVPIDEDGLLEEKGAQSVDISEHVDTSSSTPVVAGNRVYVSGGMKTAVGGELGVFEKDSLRNITTVPLRANGQSSPLAQIAEDGTVTLYVTYNGTPGGITVITDNQDGATLQYHELYTPEPARQNYCLSSIIAAEDGTLYYKNDSCYLFAIGKQEIPTDQASLHFNVLPIGASVVLTDAAGMDITPLSDDTYQVPAGEYHYTASLQDYKTKSGTLTVTPEQAATKEGRFVKISLVKQSSSGGGDISKDITVSFTLKGDTVHGETGHKSYPTWLSRRQVTLPAGSTVFDLFDMVLSEEGLSYDETSYGYISGVQAPESQGGYWLYAQDNGDLSGWMYTLNGKHVTVGCRNQKLADGDKVIWHYSDDYTKEEGSEKFNGGSGGNLSVTTADGILSYNKGGTVTPNDLEDLLGQDVTFTITPQEGYVIQDVVIDGESVGAVNRYTYEKLNKDSRIVVTFAVAEATVLNPFQDVPDNHWAVSYIVDLAGKGILKGTTETTFQPEAAISRSEFTALLARLAKADLSAYDQAPFDDVQLDAWYAKEAAWANAMGIVTGYAGQFQPSAHISRQEMAVMLQRYAEQIAKMPLPEGATLTFSDTDQIAPWAQDAMAAMVQAGIINGKENNRLAPQENATRAEAAKMLALFLTFLEKEEA